MSKPTLTSDPTYYRIEYSRVAQLLHQLTPARDKALAEAAVQSKDKPLVEALELALPETGFGRQRVAGPLSAQSRALVVTARDELSRLGWRWLGRRPPGYAQRLRRVSSANRRLAAFLADVLEPATVVLYFSCVVEEEEKFEIDGLDRPRPSKQLVDRKAGSREGKDRVSQEWLRAYLHELMAPAQAPSGAWKRAAARIGVTRWRQPSKTNYRVQYNLACLFSRLAEKASPDDRAERYVSRAAEQLELCLSQLAGVPYRALFDWAQRDPGLAELRRSRPKIFAEQTSLRPGSRR
jgi:hypothetical protein